MNEHHFDPSDMYQTNEQLHQRLISELAGYALRSMPADISILGITTYTRAELNTQKSFLIAHPEHISKPRPLDISDVT